MPGQDMSDKIGHSPSPAVERVIENNNNCHQPYNSVQDALANKHTVHPVTDISKKQ